MKIRRAMTGALATAGLACATVAPMPTAQAVKPHKETISEPYSFVAEDYCGIEDEVVIEGLFESVLQIHSRRGVDFYTEHQVVTETHTLGDVTVTRVSKPMFKDLKIVDLGDTLLITVLGTGPESTYGPDGKAISRNPGQFRFRIEVDEETGEEIEGSFTVLKESTGRTDDFCADVLPVLMG
ncbi:hypothetical protein [Nocardioides sp. GXQ0305]|uniref:hypothetical protein n=1 Tax=Nocardioides sp. GXQ0305 TaxID=3423912 RepID=UPI003D7E62B9